MFFSLIQGYVDMNLYIEDFYKYDNIFNYILLMKFESEFLISTEQSLVDPLLLYNYDTRNNMRHCCNITCI